LLALFKQSILPHDAKIIVLNVITVVESTRLYTQGKQILSRKGRGSSKPYPSAPKVVCVNHIPAYMHVVYGNGV